MFVANDVWGTHTGTAVVCVRYVVPQEYGIDLIPSTQIEVLPYCSTS